MSHSSRDLQLKALGPETDVARVLGQGVTEGVSPGMVAGIWDASRPDEIFVAAAGMRRMFPRELPELPMLPETIFDLASLTKVMATATLTAKLVDRRWLAWDTPLTAVLPRATGAEGVTIAHLLAHTAGYVAWEPLWERMRERFAGEPLQHVSVDKRQRAMREIVYAIAPEARPGERAVYSDISFLLLGYALEEVTGLSLDEAVERLVWGPMGLEDAHYMAVEDDPVRARREDVAATEDSAWRGGMLQGQVHDDNCWSMGGCGGHAGAFGTVRDVLQFACVLPRFLSRETLQAVWRAVEPPLGPAGCSRTMGWDTPSAEASSAGTRWSPGTVGHLGFTGTSLWIDPVRGRAVTLLTNRVHPSRDNNAIRAFRPRAHDVFWLFRP